jgi:hypothetical protein
MLSMAWTWTPREFGMDQPAFALVNERTVDIDVLYLPHYPNEFKES